VAILHPDGTLQITDRTKDVIKSGGEWISSVELENAAISHPALAQAAAIGLPHPRWDERPRWSSSCARARRRAWRR
jgi:fatty-acyl-CoA synthase